MDTLNLGLMSEAAMHHSRSSSKETMVGHVIPAEYVVNLARWSERKRKNVKSIMERQFISSQFTLLKTTVCIDSKAARTTLFPFNVLHCHRPKS